MRGLKSPGIFGILQSNLDRHQDCPVGLRKRLLCLPFVGVTQPLQSTHQIVVALDNATKPLFELTFDDCLWRDERKNLAGWII